jgi:hypothetical protein
MHPRFLAALAAFTLLLGAVPTASAGGWAVTTLDELPAVLDAGETYAVGYTIRQHGVTPLVTSQSAIEIRNPGTGRMLRFVGRPEGAQGHYVAQVRFPDAGAWEWTADQSPFQRQALGDITIVLATPATAPAAAVAVNALAVAAAPPPTTLPGRPSQGLAAAPPADALSAPPTMANTTARSEAVAASQSEAVAAPQSEAASASRSDALPAPQSEAVAARWSDAVAAPPSDPLAASQSDAVAAPQSDALAASRSEDVAALQSEAVAASRFEAVAAPQSEAVAARRSEAVAESRADASTIASPSTSQAQGTSATDTRAAPAALDREWPASLRIGLPLATALATLVFAWRLLVFVRPRLSAAPR